MRKADAAVEIWVPKVVSTWRVYVRYIWRKKLNICALGEMTNLGIDSNMYRKKKRYKREYEVSCKLQ